jgi:hypothetical protein
VAFLQGIETPDQAERDPLRGGLYENWKFKKFSNAV